MIQKMQKMREEKGFTLMEMLIVVAIIAILIAIAIPVFNTQLEKSRDATDAANERSAKALITTQYMLDEVTAGTTYYLDAANGTLVTNSSTLTPYGQGKTDDDNTKSVISASVDASDGTVTIDWIVPSTTEGQ